MILEDKIDSSQLTKIILTNVYKIVRPQQHSSKAELQWREMEKVSRLYQAMRI